MSLFKRIARTKGATRRSRFANAPTPPNTAANTAANTQAQTPENLASVIIINLLEEIRSLGAGADQKPALRAAAIEAARHNLTERQLYDAAVKAYGNAQNPQASADRLAKRLVNDPAVKPAPVTAPVTRNEVTRDVGNVTRQSAIATGTSAQSHQPGHTPAHTPAQPSAQPAPPSAPQTRRPARESEPYLPDGPPPGSQLYRPRNAEAYTAQPPAAPVQRTQPVAQSVVQSVAGTGATGAIALYNGSPFSDATTTHNGAFSVVIIGDRQTQTSSVLRGFLRSILTGGKVTHRPTFDIVDMQSNSTKIRWNGLERTDKVSEIDFSLAVDDDGHTPVELLATKVGAVAKLIRKRQSELRSNPSKTHSHYVLAVDGWDRYGDFFGDLTKTQKQDNEYIQQIERELPLLFQDGPKVHVTTIITARDHKRVLCDRELLHNTRLLLLGRTNSDYSGGYNAIDRVLEDSAMVPSKLVRSKLIQQLDILKQEATPLVLAFPLAANAKFALLPDMRAHQAAELEELTRALPNIWDESEF